MLVVTASAATPPPLFSSFPLQSDVDTVIKVNYDHSVCLDPITIIISIRQTIIGGGVGGCGGDGSIRQDDDCDHPKFKTSFVRPANRAFLPIDSDAAAAK